MPKNLRDWTNVTSGAKDVTKSTQLKPGAGETADFKSKNVLKEHSHGKKPSGPYGGKNTGS